MKYIFRWLLSRFLWRQHAFIQFNTKLYETAVSIEFIFNLILLKHSIPRPSPSSPRFPLQQLHRRSLLRQLGRVSCRHRSHPWSGIHQPFGWGQHRPGRTCRQAFLRKVKISSKLRYIFFKFKLQTIKISICTYCLPGLTREPGEQQGEQQWLSCLRPWWFGIV